MQRPRLNKHRESLGVEYHDFDVEGWVFQVTNKGDGRAATLADEEQEDEQEEVLWPCIHEDEEEERRYRRSQLQAAAEPEPTDGTRPSPPCDVSALRLSYRFWSAQALGRASSLRLRWASSVALLAPAAGYEPQQPSVCCLSLTADSPPPDCRF